MLFKMLGGVVMVVGLLACFVGHEYAPAGVGIIIAGFLLAGIGCLMEKN